METELEYLTRRLFEERGAAASARSREARERHLLRAGEYAMKVRGLETGAGTASEPTPRP